MTTMTTTMLLPLRDNVVIIVVVTLTLVLALLR